MKKLDFAASDFIIRRQKLLNLLPEDSATVLVFGRAPLYRNLHTQFKFRQFSDILYLCGETAPSCVLALVKNSDNNNNESFLFIPNSKEKSIDSILNKSKRRSGVHHVMPSSELNTFLFKHANSSNQIYCSFPPQQNGYPPFKPLAPYIDILKVEKDKKEIELIKKACKITRKSLKLALAEARPGVKEYEIEAKFLLENAKQGSLDTAYPTIVASGTNALSMHYNENNKIIREGECVMMDAGAEYKHYASDYTETIGIGKIPEAHKDILELVKKVKDEIVKKSKEMKFQSFDSIQMACEGMLMRGLRDLGMILGYSTLRELFPHRCSHWVGLDVHDSDSIPQDYLLRKGNVFAVEPGLYFDPSIQDVPEELAGFGCRFEETVILE